MAKKRGVADVVTEGLVKSDYDRNELRATVREQMQREREALRLYEPLPYQKQFHACHAQKCVIQKGNRTGGPTQLCEPVLTPSGWSTMGELRVGDQVIGGDGKPCNVTGIFPQGWKALFRVTFDDGAFTHCCEDHYWKCKLKKTERFPSHPNYREEKWGVYSLHDIRLHGGDEPKPRDRAAIPTAVCEFSRQETPVDPYTLGVLLGDGSIAHEAAQFSCGDAEVAEFVAATVGSNAKVVKYASGEIDYGITRSSDCIGRANPVVAGLRELSLQGTKSETKFIPETYLFNTVDVRLELLRGLMDTDGYADKHGQTFFYTCSPQLAQDVSNLVRSLGGKSNVTWKETFITQKDKRRGRPRHSHTERDLFRRRCLNMAVVWFRLPQGMCPFKLERKIERWREYGHAYTGHRLLTKIEPAGNAECVCISVDSPDHTYVTRDYIVTHNTLANMVEVARAVTGQDPHNKYPKTAGRAVILGYGESHIGTVFHRMLFRPGAFDIIRDEKTHKWRTYRPWPKDDLAVDGRHGDEHRADEKKPAPPLIPRRFIDGRISWTKRGDYVFSLVKLTTGWELLAKNSSGDPGQAQGFDANLYAIDEDLATGGWYEEAVGRIARTRGLLRWSALPHAKNPDLMNLIDHAEEEAESENPEAVVIRASILDNPYQDRKGVQDSIRAWKQMGEDVYRKRVMGEIVMDSVLMYPTYNRRIHCVIRRDGDVLTEVQRILAERQGEPPNDWTRFMVVDPGHTVCAVLFAATPPPELSRQRIIYQEAYIRNANASHFGEALDLYAKDKVFEKFIIDMHGANLTSSGDGQRPLEWYVDELIKRQLKCEQSGMSFSAGCDRIGLREEALRNWLAIERDGQPTILIVNERCPNLVREMEHFKKKTTRIGGHDIPLDEGNRRANTHAVECLEYLAADGCEYAQPRKHAIQSEWVDRVLAQDAERKSRLVSKGIILGGNHISLSPQGVPVR
jgi:hypothetical protein